MSTFVHGRNRFPPDWLHVKSFNRIQTTTIYHSFSSSTSIYVVVLIFVIVAQGKVLSVQIRHSVLKEVSLAVIFQEKNFTSIGSPFNNQEVISNLDWVRHLQTPDRIIEWLHRVISTFNCCLHHSVHFILPSPKKVGNLWYCESGLYPTYSSVIKEIVR